jgi:hypothetical protein
MAAQHRSDWGLILSLRSLKRRAPPRPRLSDRRRERAAPARRGPELGASIGAVRHPGNHTHRCRIGGRSPLYGACPSAAARWANPPFTGAARRSVQLAPQRAQVEVSPCTSAWVRCSRPGCAYGYLFSTTPRTGCVSYTSTMDCSFPELGSKLNTSAQSKATREPSFRRQS